ncbi:MAG TPA: hypothetical protein VFE47_14720, partial [Tepidisphaeraceae bacterium]|nr:hypothetical protein [Tepidisphaeraceae bacterium]
MFHGLTAQIPTQVFTADQVLSNYVCVFYAAFLLSFVATPAMRIVALHFGIIDRPDQLRKLHGKPIAYLGGVAVFVGWLFGLFISQFLALHRLEVGWPVDVNNVAHPIIPLSIVMGALIIVILGLCDDTWGLPPGIKIGGQVFAALFLLYDGIGVDSAGQILGPIILRIVPFIHGGAPFESGPVLNWFIYVASCILVIAVVVGCCNASNLMDGLDGLCSGVTAIIALGFLIVATHLAMVGGGINTNLDAVRVIVAMALLGAVLG